MIDALVISLEVCIIREQGCWPLGWSKRARALPAISVDWIADDGGAHAGQRRLVEARELQLAQAGCEVVVEAKLSTVVCCAWTLTAPMLCPILSSKIGWSNPNTDFAIYIDHWLRSGQEWAAEDAQSNKRRGKVNDSLRHWLQGESSLIIEYLRETAEWRPSFLVILFIAGDVLYLMGRLVERWLNEWLYIVQSLFSKMYLEALMFSHASRSDCAHLFAQYSTLIVKFAFLAFGEEKEGNNESKNISSTWPCFC